MVEGGGLENRFPVLRNGGSNPSPSATVAFLRGINNVGSKRISMAALKKAFEGMGFKDVRTLLASGNVIFEAPPKGSRLELMISRGLEKTFGFPVAVLIRTMGELRAMVASDPFARVPSGPNVKLYVTFLSPTARGRPRDLPSPPKNVRVVRVAPGEIFTAVTLSPGRGTPELMAFLERSVSPEFTTRNWQTVRKLADSRRETA